MNHKGKAFGVNLAIIMFVQRGFRPYLAIGNDPTRPMIVEHEGKLLRVRMAYSKAQKDPRPATLQKKVNALVSADSNDNADVLAYVNIATKNVSVFQIKR